MLAIATACQIARSENAPTLTRIFWPLLGAGPSWLNTQDSYVVNDSVTESDGTLTVDFIQAIYFGPRSSVSGSMTWGARSLGYQVEFRCDAAAKRIQFHVARFTEYEGPLGSGTAHDLTPMLTRLRSTEIDFKDGAVPQANATVIRRMQPGFCKGR